jgi:RNA polymerase-associated protein RTF1
MILKRKLKQKQSQDYTGSKLTDRQRKGQTFDTLRKKREQKQGKSREPADRPVKKYRGYATESDQSDWYSDEEPVKKEAFQMKLADALSLQVRRDDLESWLHKPMFAKVVTGCFARLALGPGEGRESVYRCVYIHDIHTYKRKYKFNKSTTDFCMMVSQGKSKREYLFDAISNQSITEKEWNRYEVTMKMEKSELPTERHINRKKKDLETIQNHVFTEEEINEMIAKKKEMQVAANTTMEQFRIELALEAAKFAGDLDKVTELERQLEDIQAFVAPSRGASQIDLIAKLNARNKEIDLKESQEAEMRALQLKRKQGRINVTDPFARRKTQPVHIVTR